ncbi:hypothetical protein [Aeromonas veronii]|uniref:hypothetical protein n=1 Tax=Aeromonas veronii TaxID=654 RepID=UPI003F746077
MEQNKNRIYEQFPLAIYCLTIYFFVLGAAYTLGRWALFPINIFDFMGVVDIAKSAAPSVVFLLTFLVVQSMLMYLTNQHGLKLAFESTVDIEGFLNKATVIAKWVIIVVILICFFGFGIVMSKGPKFISEYGNVILICMFIPIIIIIIIAYIIMINESVKSSGASHYYYMALFTLALAPFLSFSIGLVGTMKIIGGKSFNYIAIGVESGADDLMGRDRYLGYYGDKYFVWDPKDGVIKTFPSSQNLKIKRYNGD